MHVPSLTILHVVHRTPHTPAVSSCCFYGLNTMNRKLNNPGNTANCVQYFNADIRLLWLEEGGTTSLELLTVSPFMFMQ